MLLNRFYLVVVFGVVVGAMGSSSSADILGGLESYSEWTDVTAQSSIGTWAKLDGAYPVTTEGELVTAPAHGSAIPRSGELLLDLRTENQYEADNANNGANYNYSINSDDFGGINPTAVSSGTVELDYWICPDTWSGDIASFAAEGIYQTTSLLNSDGDVLASVGMYSLGDSNSPEVHYSVDGVNWTDTGLIADSSTWTNVTMSIDLDAMTSQISFTDVDSSTVTSANLAWASGVTDTTVTTLNFQQVDGISKNYFDDFAFTAITAAVPEPSVALLGFVLLLGTLAQRRRLS